MKRKAAKLDIDDAAWREAVAREAIIRPLASTGRLSLTEIAVGCGALGLRRSRLYALIERYRAAPVTSSLAGDAPGPAKGSRLLSSDLEDLIEEAIRNKYLTRQKRRSALCTTTFATCVVPGASPHPRGRRFGLASI